MYFKVEQPQELFHCVWVKYAISRANDSDNRAVSLLCGSCSCLILFPIILYHDAFNLWYSLLRAYLFMNFVAFLYEWASRAKYSLDYILIVCTDSTNLYLKGMFTSCSHLAQTTDKKNLLFILNAFILVLSFYCCFVITVP